MLPLDKHGLPARSDSVIHGAMPIEIRFFIDRRLVASDTPGSRRDWERPNNRCYHYGGCRCGLMV